MFGIGAFVGFGVMFVAMLLRVRKERLVHGCLHSDPFTACEHWTQDQKEE